MKRNSISDRGLIVRDLYLAMVSKLTEVPTWEILDRKRTRKVATARQILLWAMARLGELSTTEVATLTGRDHSTVLYSIKTVEGCLRVPGFGKETEIVEKLKEFSKQNIYEREEI